MAGSPARILMLAVTLGLCHLAWAGYLSQPTLLERIQASGELVVVTRIGPATYYRAQNGEAGLEYDLARLFAEELGVELRLVSAHSLTELFETVARRDAHLAAAALAITPERERRFRFTEPYMSVQQQLVYRSGQPRPTALGELGDKRLEVARYSNHAETLSKAKLELPDLSWKEAAHASTDDLLYAVWQGQLDYTLTNSNELALNQRYYPELRAAFPVGEPQGLAWAFPKSNDTSLYHAATSFFDRIRADGTLTHLIEKYYGHLDRFDYVGTRTFFEHVTERLPAYRHLFEEAAAETGLDWRLLAAIGYQESHWNPRAVSPTGVRGIMQLTMATAKHLGVQNRLDPAQSIFGGARYFAQARDKIPERIPEPTRTWLALAAYNIGYGHLEDARIITTAQGGNPDSWLDVKERLPLLAQPAWYTRTRFGYARGWEPVRYVENVRTYYELLVRITEPGLMQAAPRSEEPRGHGTKLQMHDSIESAY